MTILAFIFGSVVASIFGALYHLVRGGSGGQLFLYLVVSGISFWFGHLVANITGITFFSLGPIRTGLAALFTIVGLVAAEWLSVVDRHEGS
jgi:hypothetical protein